MPSVMLGEGEVMEIVETMRKINRALGDPPDYGIPDYLLDALPPVRHQHTFTLVIDSGHEELDLDIDSVKALVYEEVGDENARVSLTFNGVS